MAIPTTADDYMTADEVFAHFNISRATLGRCTNPRRKDRRLDRVHPGPAGSRTTRCLRAAVLALNGKKE